MAVLAGKKILYLITKSNWGGAQAYVYTLATEAKQAGADVVVALGGDGALAERLTSSGIRTVRLPLGRDVSFMGDYRAYEAIAHLVSREQPDILHVNSSKAGGLGALAGRLHHVPRIIYTAHGWAHREPRAQGARAAIWFFSWLTVLLSHSVIVVSKKDYRDAPAVLSRWNIVLIQNGIAPFPLLTRDIARGALRERVPSAHPNRLWIVMNGELHRNKGVDVAIRAFASIDPDAQLLIMGEGEEHYALEQLIQNLKLTDRVYLLGFIPESRNDLSAGDIYLLSSRKEGLPFALLEAGLARLPVIASDTGGVSDVITDGETGLLVPPDDVPALARALTRLIEDKNLRARLGTALYQKVTHDFNEAKMVEATLALY